MLGNSTLWRHLWTLPYWEYETQNPDKCETDLLANSTNELKKIQKYYHQNSPSSLVVIIVIFKIKI